VSNDDLWLIENPELRRKLRIWPPKLLNVRSAIAGQYELYRDRYMPYLEANSLMQQISNASFQQPGNTGIAWPGERIEVKDPVSHRKLLSDRVFQNLLTQRITWITEMLTFVPIGTRDDLDEIIVLIERELGAMPDND
jgi:hypothetical protein